MDSWHDDEDDFAENATEEWKSQGKDALIFLIDCSPKMHVKVESNSSDSDTPFKMALRCLHATLRNKIFANPNDCIGVLMFGTTNKVDVRDFSGLSLLIKIDKPDGDSILKIEQMLEDTDTILNQDYGGSSDSSYAIHEALWQCQAMFNEVTGKVASKTILLFTCNDDPHANDSNLKRQSLKKAQDLRETNIYLELLSIPGVNEQFDVAKYYADMLPNPINKDDSIEDQVAASTQKLDDLMRIVRKRIHKKRSVKKLEWDLGGGNVLSFSVYNLVQRATKPPKTMLARDTNEPIMRQRNFIHPATGAPLLPSDIDMYQEYGGRRIRFTQDEVKSMMAMDMKLGLKLVGFKPLEDLKFSHYVQPCNFIYPDDLRIKGSRTLFSALLQRCLARSVMPICTLKASERAKPSFVALIPQDEVKDNDENGTGEQISPPGTKKIKIIGIFLERSQSFLCGDHYLINTIFVGFSIFYLPFADDVRSVPNDTNFVLPDEEQVKQLITVLQDMRAV